MVSETEEAADKTCMIAARKMGVTKYLRSLIPTGMPVPRKTHEVTI